MPNPLQTGQKDVTLLVWAGVVGLLLLAVGVHEGWFSSSSSQGGDGTGVGSTSTGGVTGSYGGGGFGNTGFSQVDSLSTFWDWIFTI